VHFSYLFLFGSVILIPCYVSFHYLSQARNHLCHQAVSIVHLAISVIQFLEHASKVG
jgi:hypothetical protein